MNTPIDPFEDELRSLQPAEPSPRLARALAAGLANDTASTPYPTREHTSRLRQASLWLPWGIAAAMTVAFFSRPPVAPVPTDTAIDAPAAAAGNTSDASPQFTPVSSSNTLIAALDEGVVYLEDGRPARKVRYEFLDTVNLLSTDDSRATLKVTYPREEIRLVPVQTY